MCVPRRDLLLIDNKKYQRNFAYITSGLIFIAKNVSCFSFLVLVYVDYVFSAPGNGIFLFYLLIHLRQKIIFNSEYFFPRQWD